MKVLIYAREDDWCQTQGGGPCIAKLTTFDVTGTPLGDWLAEKIDSRWNMRTVYGCEVVKPEGE